jgi:benzoate-CoA ligase family protein
MATEFPDRFNMADYFLYHNLREGRSEKVCLYYRDERFTYGQVAEMSDRTGNVLRELGVDVEDRVLLVLPDCPEFVYAWFGAAKIGGVIAMVNTILPASDYAYYLEYTRARVAIVHHTVEDRIEEARGSARDLKHVLVVGGDGRRNPSFERMTSDTSPTCEPEPTSKDDLAIWLFTSGSTGKPKAAVHLQHDLPYNTECYAKRVLGIAEDDVTAGVPKLFFGYATGTNLLFPFAVGGATALFEERSTAEKMFEIVDRYRPTILTSVPTMINAMLGVEGAKDRYDLSSLRYVLSAGEALPPELYRRWMDAYGVEILDGIGSAEMFHIYVSNVPGRVVPGALGSVVPGYEARVVGPDGADVPDGEVGELWIKGDSAALCYWRAHEASKERFAGDWCFTGDQFRRDSDGVFWYQGRSDFMLKVSGIWVSPLEIENCLLGHEAVAECCVVGRADEHELVKPLAYVVVAPGGATPGAPLVEALQGHAKAAMAPYKYPRWIEFVDELPKNDRGKIDRKVVEGWAARRGEG